MHFDPEKLISQWWSISSLTMDCEDGVEQSYSDSEPFWEGLFTLHQKGKRSPPQSQLSKQYDFYYDCILRHQQTNEVAYTLVTPNHTDNWTFRQLHHCVNYQVRSWSKHNPQPGQLVALVLSPGIEYLIALLTALRYGLKICFLPPQSPLLGQNQITKMLAAIKPQLIVTEERRSWSKEIPHLEIDPKGQDEENHEPHSFSYTAKTIVQTTLALHRQEPLAFVPLDAHTMYLHAVRDALLSLNLIENPSWASPLACPILTEPCSTLASLLAAARRVYVPDAAILNDPNILKDERLYIIGISPSLQQLWSRNPVVPTRYLKAFYKNPLDVTIQAWKSFIQLNRIDKVPRFELLMDNSQGGATLLTRPHLEFFNLYLKPNPGTSWCLNDMGGSGQQSTINFGFFSTQLSCAENSQKETNLYAMINEKCCILGGAKNPARNGVTFPVEEVEQIVNSFPFVEACMVLPLDAIGHMAHKDILLLVFTNPMNKATPDENQWSREISQRITENLGSGFIPDRIEYYPLIPKMKPEGIDRNWCNSHYYSGLLKKKSESPVFRLLHSLKKIASGAPTNGN